MIVKLLNRFGLSKKRILACLATFLYLIRPALSVDDLKIQNAYGVRIIYKMDAFKKQTHFKGNILCLCREAMPEGDFSVEGNLVVLGDMKATPGKTFSLSAKNLIIYGGAYLDNGHYTAEGTFHAQTLIYAFNEKGETGSLKAKNVQVAELLNFSKNITLNMTAENLNVQNYWYFLSTANFEDFLRAKDRPSYIDQHIMFSLHAENDKSPSLFVNKILLPSLSAKGLQEKELIGYLLDYAANDPAPGVSFASSLDSETLEAIHYLDPFEYYADATIELLASEEEGTPFRSFIKAKVEFVKGTSVSDKEKFLLALTQSIQAGYQGEKNLSEFQGAMGVSKEGIPFSEQSKDFVLLPLPGPIR